MDDLPVKVQHNRYVYEILPWLILTSHAKARLFDVLEAVSFSINSTVQFANILVGRDDREERTEMYCETEKRHGS